MTIGIGNTLKEARSKRSVTLEDVHAKTKIHPRILQLLEEEKFDKIPSPLFVKSFLKSYAEFLELSPEEMISLYEKQATEPLQKQSIYIESEDERQRRARSLSRDGVLIAAVVLASGLAAYIGYDLIKTMSHPTVSRQKKTISSKSSSQGPAKERGGSAGLLAAEKNPNAAGEWLRSPAQGNFPRISGRTSLILEIKALENVWMRVTCDGKVLFESILKSGATETWTADNKIEIWTGNASAMKLELNKTDLGSPGKGVVKKMVITHEGVRKLAA